MTNQEYKDLTISNLFRGRTIHLKIEGMLFRYGLNREPRAYIEPEIISETFLQLSRIDADKFYEKFNNNPSQLEATTVLIAKNIGILNSAKPLGEGGLKRPKGCLVHEMKFASSFSSGNNNVLEPTENNIDYDGMSSNGCSNAVLADKKPDRNDKHQVFEYLRETLTEAEFNLLDLLTNQRMKPGRKKADVQLNIDLLKLKISTLLSAYSKNYYKEKAWSIGEQMKSMIGERDLTDDENSRLSKYASYQSWETVNEL